MRKTLLTYFFCLNLFLSSFVFSTNIIVPGSLTHENNVTPKQIIQGTIPIQNTGDEIASVQITLTDYSFNANGESFFPDKGTLARSNASWISTDKMQFNIAPHSTYSFPYSLQVPEDTSLAGSFWSIFLVESVAQKLSTPDLDKSLGVQTIIRYGVQVITHIENKGSYELKILDKKITKEAEKRIFFLSVENPGTLMQTPSLFLELVDQKGKKIERLEAYKQRILPNCSVTYQIDLSNIPIGTYKAMAILDHGGNSLFGAKYDLKID
ncbi:MAG: hypothetical protein V4489_00580 [Chlamydiota bacterium]